MVHSLTDTETHILAALGRGDRVVTEQVYRQNYPIINGWLIKNGGNAEDAADIFQEAMVVLFGKAQNPDFRLTSSVSTYLLAVSKHLWYKKLQQLQRAPQRLADDGEEGSHDATYEEDLKVHLEREAHYEQLNASLDMLGEPCRSLLKAFYHHDKSMQEISADFGYTNPENAKTQKYKCLMRLKKLFFATQAK